MNTIGFSENEKPSSYQKGNNTVTENNDNHIHGHITIWCRKFGFLILFKTPNLLTKIISIKFIITDLQEYNKKLTKKINLN